MKQLQTLEALKLLFHAGALRDCRAVHNPVGAGWLLEFDARTEGGGWNTIAMKRDRGGARSFSSLDTLCGVVTQLGFREFRVVGGAR